MAKDTTVFLLKLDRKDERPLFRLRTESRLEVAETKSFLWVRANQVDKALQQQLKALPSIGTYRLEQGLLFPEGGSVPTGSLPTSLKWQAVGDWVTPEPPPSVMPPLKAPEPAWSLELVKATQEQAVVALLVKADAWFDYVETAPKARLDALSFALSDDKRALIIGQPLPPLPGQLYWQVEQLLLPAGWSLAHPVLGPLLSQSMSPKSGGYALVHDHKNWEVIPFANVIAADRASVRLSSQNLK
jgi:hypothetical protein